MLELALPAVLHREAKGQEPIPGDPWASCEFHVKWKRYAYVHCSWDTRATLSQLGGYKRLINYMKKWDDLQVLLSKLTLRFGVYPIRLVLEGITVHIEWGNQALDSPVELHSKASVSLVPC